MANIPQWKVGDVLSASKLNAMVDAINNLLADQTGNNDVYITLDELNDILKQYSDIGHTHSVNEIVDLVLPTKLSQLQNDTSYVTEDYVTNAIANAQLGGDGEVDLSAYATKNYVDSEIGKIELTPGPQGEQGPKGETGEQGPKGETGERGPAGADGKTPVKGVDYFTADDKVEMLNGYATEAFVNNAIAEAQLGGEGGEVNLDGLVAKNEVGNASQILFSDGQSFQSKLDNGLLQGPKGDQGEQGIQGPKGDQGPAGADGVTPVKGVDYFTEEDKIEMLDGYATETFVNNAIANAQLGGGSNNIVVDNIEPAELDVPRVYFYGDALPTTKDNVKLEMDYKSNTMKFHSYIKLKCQGTSSMSYAKKNFTLTMYEDSDRSVELKKNFKGWGAQNKFCLKANWVDSTHSRNLSGARIAYDMVKSRPDSPFKQELLKCPRNGAVDGFPIKVYFNGEFWGIYTFNIPKDAWMFNMNEDNPNHVVLCAERNTDGNSNLINSCQFRKLWDGVNEGDWSYEVGTPSDAVKDSLNRGISFVMNSTDQEFHDNISEYFDLYSLLDYYCFSYAVCHLDGLAKNMLLATYDGVVWGACLYDMDSIYGVYWNGSSFVSPEYKCPEQYQEQFSRLWVRIEECFADELRARYAELRQHALSLTNIVGHVEEIYDLLSPNMKTDETTKWPSIPTYNTNTITRFRNYMRDRVKYTDAEIALIGVFIACESITLSKTELKMGIFNGEGGTKLLTYTLRATVLPTNTMDEVVWSVEPTGICTVVNGRVTAVNNGDCVITATCGQQSATCAVNVSGISGEQQLPADVLFELSEPIIGDGTESTPYIDTNIQLMSEENINNNWTILVECMGNISGTNAVVHCMLEQPEYPGISIDYMYDSLRVVRPNNHVSSAALNCIRTQTGAAIVKDGNTFTIYDKLGNVINTAEVRPTAHNSTLVIGAYKDTSGNYGRYLNGKIFKFRLSSNAYTVREIIDYFNINLDTLPKNTVVYELNEPQVLDGSSKYVNTEIPLCEGDIDYTIFMNFKMNVSSSAQQSILHCMTEVNPYPGINLKVSAGGIELSGAGISPAITTTSDNKAILSSQTTEVQPFVIRRQGSTIQVISKNGTGSATYTHYGTLQSLLLGAYQTADGVPGRYANITINQAKVWTKALTDEEIQSLING